MAISEDVLEIVAILTDEGFGVLAGELLSEISLGSEAPSDEQPLKPAQALSTEEFVLLNGNRRISRRYRDETGGVDPTESERLTIPEHRQLEVAIGIIRQRLVEPMRRHAEAERIAGTIAIEPEPPPDPDEEAVASSAETPVVPIEPEKEKPLPEPVRIVLDQELVVEAVDSAEAIAPGETRTVDELDRALGRLDRTRS